MYSGSKGFWVKRYWSRSPSSPARVRTARRCCGLIGSRAGRGLRETEALFQLAHFTREGNDYIRERIFDVFRIGDHHPLAVLINDVRGYADHGRVRRHVAQHDRSGADARILTDGDVSENVRVVSDEDAFEQRGMSLPFFLAGAAEGHALVEGAHRHRR